MLRSAMRYRPSVMAYMLCSAMRYSPYVMAYMLCSAMLSLYPSLLCFACTPLCCA
jgi:hypothetical protein